MTDDRPFNAVEQLLLAMTGRHFAADGDTYTGLLARDINMAIANRNREWLATLYQECAVVERYELKYSGHPFIREFLRLFDGLSSSLPR